MKPRLLPPMSWALSCLLVLAGMSAVKADEPGSWHVRDKTFVAWVTLANRAQRGGSVLTLENLPGQFDALVFGEIEPGRWMAGSDFFRRTCKDQSTWPAETAEPGKLIQVAVSYRGKDVTLSRDGQLLARYAMETDPAGFNERSIALIGKRHWETSSEGFQGEIEEARIYGEALDVAAIASLRPNEASGPQPLGWWTFEDGSAADRMGRFPTGRLIGQASISDGRLILRGGFLLAGRGIEPPRTREQEDWPTYHVSALPEEGLCRPYDANGCIYWKGKYHLMYIYQDPKRPHGGHCWGHAVSTDLVNWTFLPPSVVPEPGDPDVGIFSGNAFINKEGRPMLCWFGINAGVCVATAEDDDLIRWKKHPRNPIVPMPKPGQPGHGVYTVWDPYLWLEGDTYYCLLGGNTLKNGKDTLYMMRSADLVNWTPLHPFYEHPDLTWTTKGEDCSCPDFFRIGDKHALLCISHKVGGRIYLGTFKDEKFHPEQHVRMNWPGGQFFAPESLIDGKGRRIIWAWVTDPRTITTQQSTGSGVQSLPRVLSLAPDGTLLIRPVEELETLRRHPRSLVNLPIRADAETPLKEIQGDRLELALEIDPGDASEVGLAVRCSPDGKEATEILHRVHANELVLGMARSTLRSDVVYTRGPLDTGGVHRAADYPDPRKTVEAPFSLRPGEPLRLRVFLDGPMLEVFANDRQCITQQVFPSRKDSVQVRLLARGGSATLSSLQAWDMAPARFVNRKG
ncbi:MAG: GH32 C-terminal domain-containing protein [Isosphaeraceae bacterium]